MPPTAAGGESRSRSPRVLISTRATSRPGWCRRSCRATHSACQRAAQFGLFDEDTADRVAVALTEAMVNGIQHGNLELDSRLRQEDEATYDRMAEFRRRRPPYRDRRLHVRAALSRRGAVYVIRDEGPGFDPATLPDPTDPAYLERPTGRGLLLIRAFMDEVAFNRAGNQVILTKRRTAPPNAHDR